MVALVSNVSSAVRRTSSQTLPSERTSLSSMSRGSIIHLCLPILAFVQACERMSKDYIVKKLAKNHKFRYESAISLPNLI